MDSHNCRRYVEDGRVWNEGDVQVKLPKPYGVGYGAIVPKRGECANLFVPVALSASHIAFGSIRMEPVFMVLAQSAALAADLVLRTACDVQDVRYADLKPALDAAGQVAFRDPQRLNPRRGNEADQSRYEPMVERVVTW
jgi:hypothetical protein